MSTILWEKPNKTLAITYVIEENIDLIDHAEYLKNIGSIKSDWSLVATEVSWSDDTRWKHETYRWDGSKVIPDLEAAREETKERLREERTPLLQELDIKFQRNLETGADNSQVISEKNRLRDITLLADNATTLDELFNIRI